jgi:hypothetical protein
MGLYLSARSTYFFCLDERGQRRHGSEAHRAGDDDHLSASARPL